jgi:predicted Co/Zn/Cd cation transporter (cation efflux family)
MTKLPGFVLTPDEWAAAIKDEMQRIRERAHRSLPVDPPSNLVLVDFTRGRRAAVEGDL